MEATGMAGTAKAGSKKSQTPKPVCEVCGKSSQTPICPTCADKIRAEAVARKRREDKGLE